MIEALASILMVSFLLILSQLSPGPDVFFVFRTALAQGFRAGSAVALGISTGFLIQTLLVCWVGTWFMDQPWSHYVLVAAAAWLLYLAWKIFPRHLGGLKEDLEQQENAHASLLSLIRAGFLCNILNPKCALFIMGLMLTPLGMYGDLYAWYTPVFVAAFFLASQLGWMLWCGLLQWAPLRGLYVRHASVVDAVFSVLLAFFAVCLLIA